MTLCFLGTLLAAVPAGAQGPPESTPEWVGHAGLVAVNVAVGGVATAVTAWLRGEDVARAFTWGSIGGSLSVGGKVLAAREPEWGGLAGRQISEAGHSVAANVAAGGEPWDELWMAFGPVRVRYWNRGEGSSLPLRLNVQDALVVSEFLLRSETRLRVGQSLASGTFVFDTPGRVLAGRSGDGARGAAWGSVVALSAGDFDRKATLGHELVHVIQSDLLTRLVLSPAQDGLLRRLGWESRAMASVELLSGVVISGWEPIYELFEAEARHLDRRRR